MEAEKFTRRLVLQLQPETWTRFETEMSKKGFTSFTGALLAMLDAWAADPKGKKS